MYGVQWGLGLNRLRIRFKILGHSVAYTRHMTILWQNINLQHDFACDHILSPDPLGWGCYLQVGYILVKGGMENDEMKKYTGNGCYSS